MVKERPAYDKLVSEPDGQRWLIEWSHIGDVTYCWHIRVVKEVGIVRFVWEMLSRTWPYGSKMLEWLMC